jgi:indole-3-glycerol phosphate synthase/phosphoribosylanthranilate isomerase
VSRAGVLGESSARKRVDVAQRLGAVTLDELRARAEPTRRSLKAALGRPGARFIMEVKRASPSQGMLRPDADPAAMARAYRGAADAISVLVDGPYFGGSYADLQTVRAVFDGPILAKDFVVDPRQVPEARMHGADAVLVMLSVLDDAEAAAVMAEARRLGMDVLVEAHDEAEVRRALGLGRGDRRHQQPDLKTLKVDLATTERLSPLVPKDRLLVAESGIADRAGRGAPQRACRCLPNRILADAGGRSRPGGAGARLWAGQGVRPHRSPRSRTGRRTRRLLCGLVMVPNTPRAVDRNAADAIARAGAARGIPLVGVFRNEKVEQVAQLAHRLGFGVVQLHGQEDAGYIKALRAMLPETCEIWAASAVGGDVPEPRTGADRTLFDTAVGGRSGGTGIAFDWSRVSGRIELAGSILAGGLKPANARAAAAIGAYALDVSSGVEMAPGRKDAGKLHAFFEALRLPVRGERATC